MSWYRYTVALAVPSSELPPDFDPQSSWPKATDDAPFVYIHSRNDAVRNVIKRVSERASLTSSLYLLGTGCVLSPLEAKIAANNLSALLSQIDRQPELVVEATKIPHQPFTDLLMHGRPPIPVEVVYPKTATVKNGWVYVHTPEEVRSSLQSAVASRDPRPARDEEGESLEYALGMLKSHLWLLSLAAQSGFVVVFRCGDA